MPGKKAAEVTAAAAPAERPRAKFDNRILQQACASYFQSHLDQLTPAPIAGMVCLGAATKE